MTQLFASARVLRLLLLYLLSSSVSIVVGFGASNFASSNSNKDNPSTPWSASSPQTQFPTQTTTPTEVLRAQLSAFQASNMTQIYDLFSRSRRLSIQDSARRDVREFHIPQSRIHASLRTILERDCADLVGHKYARVLSVVGDPSPPKRMLKTRICRVQIDNGRYFVFTMTRQSPFDGGDPRDNDGYEKCWFVWKIVPEAKGGWSDGKNIPSPDRSKRTRRRKVFSY